MTNSNLQQTVIDHLHLVKIIALKIASRLPHGIELDDLIHSGILGLIDAVKKYDSSKGTKFATYASLRIRGAILDELRHLDWASRSLRQKIKDLEHTFLDLETALGRPPQEEEVAQKMKIPINDFYKIMDEAKGIGSGVYRYAEADNETGIASERLLNYYGDTTAQTPDLLIEKEEITRVLTAFIEELPEKEKMILNMYYTDGLNLKEIAIVLNLTESRICQLRSAAILRLRAKLNQLASQYHVGARDIL